MKYHIIENDELSDEEIIHLFVERVKPFLNICGRGHDILQTLTFNLLELKVIIPILEKWLENKSS